MSTIIIKHKTSDIFSNEQAPGKSVQGIAGDAGLKGDSGRSLYFTNYELNNSYYQDLCLQRIDNNTALSNNRSTSLDEREYKSGDIIVSLNSDVYTLVNNDNKNANHKFYIKHIGKITKKSDYIDLSERIQYINIESYKDVSTMICMIPSNRTFHNDTDYNNDECKTLVGYKFKANLIMDFIDIVDNDYEFSLEIKLKNEKNIILDSYKRFYIPGISEQSFNKFVFYKKIEIPLSINASGDSSIFISDMVCDKLHPSGNEISTTYMDSSNAIVIKQQDDTYYGYDYIVPTDSFDMLSVFDWTDNNKSQKFQSRYDYINNAFKNISSFALFGIDICSDYRDYRYYNDSSYFAINYRCGESAYFSGINDASIYDTPQNIIDNIENISNISKIVPSIIRNFIFSKNNVYTLIYRNINTNIVKRILIPFEMIKMI